MDVYRTVKAQRPDVQLVPSIGSMAADDPEGWEVPGAASIDYTDGDEDVFILSNLDNVGSVEINAFQCVGRTQGACRRAPAKALASR